MPHFHPDVWGRRVGVSLQREPNSNKVETKTKQRTQRGRGKRRELIYEDRLRGFEIEDADGYNLYFGRLR